ncbi:unnamed protein product, partial [Laminaria digitata]
RCLVCQCEFEDSEELTRLPCDHTFHTGDTKYIRQKKCYVPLWAEI